jgi:chromosomal replication initiation ATPase DnaA
VELLSRILTSVAKAFGVKELALLSKERGKELDLARAVAYYLTARLSGLPHPEIAGLFERDRVTLKSGIARVERLVSEDKELAAKIAKLEEGLRPKPTARAAAQ